MSDTELRGEAVIMRAGSDERQRALEQMLAHAERGGTVIVGTLKPLHIDVPVGRVGDKFLVVKRRATREEFLANAPVPPADGDQMAVPFYWELVVQQ